MGDHLVLDVNRPIKRSEEMAGPSSSNTVAVVPEENGGSYDEEAPLLTMAECRICQEEDSIDSLETPCACNGSLKYAHRKCVQHWCNEKGDITCEICHQPYQPGYVAPPPRPCLEETTIDIGGAWQISEAERQYLEAEYDDYNATNASGAAFCRSAVLILMALLLLRHASSVPDSEGDGDGDEDASTFLTVSGTRMMLGLITEHSKISTQVQYFLCLTAFLASGCWISSALLHHGVGHQHFAASKAKTGGGGIGGSTICFRVASRTKKRVTLHGGVFGTCTSRTSTGTSRTSTGTSTHCDSNCSSTR